MRSAKRSMTVVALAAATAILPASGALASTSSSPADSAPGSDPAVVGALLQIFTFGSDVGIPTGCQAASSTLGAGAAQYGLAQATFPLIQAINDGCTSIQTQADTYIALGQANDSQLSAINPYANALLQVTGDQITTVGTQYADALAPFGPTIAGTGATIEYFEGH